MIFKLECKYHSPINLLIYCWQVWKFALAKKGPKSSVISAPVFPGSPGSWPWGVLSLAEFTHKGSKQQNCQMESLPSHVFSLFFRAPFSLSFLPCSFWSSWWRTPHRGSPVQSSSTFWFSSGRWHRFCGFSPFNCQETEINLTTYSWIPSIKNIFWVCLQETQYSRCQKDSIEHTGVLVGTEYTF